MAQPSAAATAPSTLPASIGGVQVPTAHIAEQSISTTFHIEVMNDPETGQPMLIGSSDPHHGDLQVVTADQIIAKADEQHRTIAKAVRLALDYEAATRQAPTGKPRSWTIADSQTGMPLNGVCMVGCHGGHLELGSGRGTAEEVLCTQYDQANSTELPISCGSDDGEDWATLSVEIKSYPVHPDEEKRIPLAAIEVTEDHYIEDLDPDGLAVVIDKLQQRVNAMHIRHAELIRARNEYLGRQA
ncbi:DUF6907 domain-containing protein [Streptomyces sp. NPDC047990]|uniref:DUF6907 domain-containing protein n=1 Tax=Streptomyces sp. NPDC047990 TaxID=3365496 RepID=UPI003722810A